MSRKIYTDSDVRKKFNELTSYPYDLFVKQTDKPKEPQLSDIIPNSGKRKDGRGFSEHRKIFMKCGVVEDARGSAYVEMGGTKVIASVTGPVEMPQNQESEEKGFLNCEVRFSQFSCKTRDEEEELGTEIETVTDGLNRALEPAVIKEELANVQLNVVVTVVESDGSVISACVNASSLAIANARVPMYDLVSSVTMATLPDGTQLLDPTLAEEEYSLTRPKSHSLAHSHGVLTLSHMTFSDQVTDFVMSGKLEVDAVLPSLPVLTSHCTKIYMKIQRLLKKDVRQIADVIVAKNTEKEEEKETTSIIRDELAKLST